MTLVRLFARPMLSSMFIYGGINALKNAARHARPRTGHRQAASGDRQGHRAAAHRPGQQAARPDQRCGPGGRRSDARDRQVPAARRPSCWRRRSCRRRSPDTGSGRRRTRPSAPTSRSTSSRTSRCSAGCCSPRRHRGQAGRRLAREATPCGTAKREAKHLRREARRRPGWPPRASSCADRRRARLRSCDGDRCTTRPLARAARRRAGPRRRPVPGSKSITNRALVLAALADGPASSGRALRSRDTELMAARAARAGRRRRPDAATDWTVVTRRRCAGRRDDRLRPGRHGDALRAAGRRAGRRPGRLRRRPARADPPDGRGARARCARSASGSTTRTAARCRSPSTAPARVRGGAVTIDASASSQFVSALLLAGAAVRRGRRRAPRRQAGAVAAAHRDDRRACCARTASRSTTPTPNRWRVRPGADRAPSTSPSSPTCPTPRRSWPPRWSPAAGSRCRTGRARTTQAGDALREILGADGRHASSSPTTA